LGGKSQFNVIGLAGTQRRIVHVQSKGNKSKLGIVSVAILIALGLFVHVSLKSFGQIHPRLIGQAHQDPQHIGHFIAQVFTLFSSFEGLVAVFTGHEPGQLAHFFGEYSHVGQLREIANTYGSNPLVDPGLHFF
jgi:hypothetical protein